MRDHGFMRELTLPGLATLILTTGVVTAVINQVLAGWLAGRRQRSEQAHQRALQEDQREHERRLRVEEAHAKARQDFLEDVAGALDWLSYEWGNVHGLDADWVPDHDPTPRFKSITEVIQALRCVELRHPTRTVRELARTLRENVSAHYGSIQPVWNHQLQEHEQRTGVPPGFDTFADWVRTGESLIDAIHEPPH
jgi:hypothetical protein